MTVKELKEQLDLVDDNLIVIVEWVEDCCGCEIENNALAHHIEYNDNELYIVT